MATRTTSSGAGLERALRHWRERGALLKLPSAEPAARGVTIAISRQCGAGGSEVAQALAHQLNWPLYDRELVEKIAADTGVQEQLLSELDERRPNWLAECWEGFSREKQISGGGMAIQLKKVLLALYCHGDCIVLGRGAAQVLPPDRCLFVRLFAPEEFCVERMAQRLHASAQEARQHCRDIDRGRDEFVKSYFHKDPADASHYDVIVNTSRVDVPTCVAVVTAALQGKPTSQ